VLEKEGEEPLAGRGSDDYGAQDFFNMKCGGETNLLAHFHETTFDPTFR